MPASPPSRLVEGADPFTFALDLSPPGRRGPWRQAITRFCRRPLALGAAGFVLVFFSLGALASVLAPYPAGRLFLEYVSRPQAPAVHRGHLLGTDVLGHDFLTQLLYAIQQSALLALVATVGAAAIGVVLGALAGFYRGWIDVVVTWLTSFVVAVPAIAVLLLVVIYKWPLTPRGFGVSLLIFLWAPVARAVRARFLSLRQEEYVEAARALGASDLRLIGRHMLPNSAGLIIVSTTALVGQSILIVATVCFLGFGTEQAEKPTLGSLIAHATPGPTTPWWLSAPPVLILSLLLVSINYLGDVLDETLNPIRRA